MEKNFSPNIRWMAEKYDEMNAMLFDGKLGSCSFGIFTTGKGSGGNTLGWFKLTGSGIKIDRYNRQMYCSQVFDYNSGMFTQIYINKDNFVKLCKPRIELNGNYKGTEHAFLGTLVHEMCHYYTYMNGWAPTQAHGREFKSIGQIVSSRSNGLFTIQRLASAEEMTEFELNDEMKARAERRLKNKKKDVYAVIGFCKNGEIRLTLTKSVDLVEYIRKRHEMLGEKCTVTENQRFIDFLFENGYGSISREYYFWRIQREPWINNFKEILNNGSETLSNDETPVSEKAKQRTFVIKTTNGEFRCDFTSEEELINKIKERFPKMNDETIRKIMSNPSNYVNEGKRTMKDIINEVIEEFIANETGMNVGNNKDIEINPNMNLGKYSPLEL